MRFLRKKELWKCFVSWNVLLTVLFPMPIGATENSGVSAKAAVLIEQSTGQVLFG